MSRLLPLLASVLFLSACSEQEHRSLFAASDCHRLALTDQATGGVITGIEDIVVLPGGDLLLSAYDRRADTGGGVPPEGGLYRLSPSLLGEREALVEPLLRALPGGLRPHGIDALARPDGSLRVAFVNRGYDADGMAEPALVRFTLEDGVVGALDILEDERFCRANDLTFFTGSNGLPALAVTLDRHYCAGFYSTLEMITGREEAAVVITDAFDHAELAENLAFANGIVISNPDRPLGKDNPLVVAETRANRLSMIPETDPSARIELPGSPDNLTFVRSGFGEDGNTDAVLAALHPSLMRLALYRYGFPGFDTSASRIVRIADGKVELLFNDPTGAVYSAASVAVLSGLRLVLGSVGERGLLVCGRAGVS
ncbi:MAG: hypothetical protein H2045_04240 [Rhizobiales bacterium]|nr:hypothetical protein [Hyphomicrobiales bacterium]